MILAALALAIAPPNSHAGGAAIQGLGLLSCGRWTTERAAQPASEMRVALTTWLGGYISGYNFRGGGDILKGVDFDGAVAWVDNYCAAHPLDTVAYAAGGLIIDMDLRHARQR